MEEYLHNSKTEKTFLCIFKNAQNEGRLIEEYEKNERTFFICSKLFV